MASKDRPMRGLLGGYLRDLREKCGLTQREVGDELDVSHVFVGEMERGMRGLPWTQREDMAELYGASSGVLHVLDVLDRQELLSLRDATVTQRRLAVVLVAAQHGVRLSAQEMQVIVGRIKSWATQRRGVKIRRAGARGTERATIART